ncbi:MAG: hypothetical protein ABEJ25_07505 [Candidatus Bipolaricaulia bacterium]
MGWGLSEEIELDKVRVTKGEFAKSDSISDFNLVFLDPEGIELLWTDHLTPQSDGRFRTNPNQDGGLANGLDNLLQARREEVVQLLERVGGVIFCKLRKPGRGLSVLTGDEEKLVNRYSWLPDKERKTFRSGRIIEPRKGTHLAPVDMSTPVVSFLKEFREEVSYEAVFSEEGLSERQSFEVLARTPSDDIASLGFTRGKGNFVFLPARMDLGDAGVQKLVETAKKVMMGGAYYRPSWLDEYTVPAEEDIREELKEIDREVSRLKKQKKKKTEKLGEIDQLKGLLSSRTDSELKESLSRALEVAGFDVEEGCAGIDLIVSDSEEVNLAITVGAHPDALVGLDPYHRLVEGINELKIFENKDPQGVVVVNGFGSKNPDSRGDQLKEELLKGCNLYGFTVVTADKIFERIKEIKKGKVGSREGLIDLFETG